MAKQWFKVTWEMMVLAESSDEAEAKMQDFAMRADELLPTRRYESGGSGKRVFPESVGSLSEPMLIDVFPWPSVTKHYRFVYQTKEAVPQTKVEISFPFES